VGFGLTAMEDISIDSI